MASVSMTVNGQAVTRDVEPRTLLVDFLRQHLDLTGTHVGCDTSQCGACVVHVNGVSVKSCTVLALQAAQAQITTIEGLAKDGELHPMQAAFREHHGLQCGFCTPGMIMSAVDLVKRNPDPSEEEIREWLEGNLCRCTGYHNIVKAIQRRCGGHEELKRMATNGIGASVRRKEDQRFITGTGHFTDDIDRPGQVYAYFVRSPHAHARIRGIDKSRAAAAPGVLAVFTGDDVKAAGWGNLICGWMVKSRDGSRHEGRPASDARPGQGALCRRRRRLRGRGDLSSRRAMRPSCSRSTTRSCRRARRPHAPATRARRRSTTTFRATRSTSGSSATRRRWIRRSPAPRTSPGSIWSTIAWCRTRSSRAPRSPNTTAAPRASRSTPPARTRTSRAWCISAFIGVAPEHKLRVIAPDVGGGFGSKIFIYPEECVCLLAAKRVGRPVKWTAERTESFLSDAHGRDHITHAELAMDADGNFTALKVHTIANMGAYLSTFASCVPTYLYGTLLAGQYKTPAIYCAVDAVYTNTTPVDAYRGAGRPEATYLLETIVETAARETGPRSRRAAAQELHPEERLPLSDAGRAAVRHRRLRGLARRGARARRLQELRAAARRLGGQGQAARGRLLLLHRGVRHRAIRSGRLARLRRGLVGERQGPLQPHRHGAGAHRHPHATARATRPRSRS